jgi:DNA-binding GntR family transcriptional regulator
MHTAKVLAVKFRIIEALTSGVYKAGDRFSSIRELTIRYSISPRTARLLVIELGMEGKLHRRRGVGAFVPGGLRRSLQLNSRTLSRIRHLRNQVRQLGTLLDEFVVELLESGSSKGPS